MAIVVRLTLVDVLVGLIVAALLCACGTNGVPAGTVLPTASGSPDPIHTPQYYIVSTLVVDGGTNGGSGLPIRGAHVSFFTAGTSLQHAVKEITSADGKVEVSMPAGRYAVEITPPGNSKQPTGYDYPFYHSEVSVDGPLSLQPIHLDALTNDDQMWILQNNIDRTRFGSSLTVKADEVAMTAARAWANYLALHPDAAHYGPLPAETWQQRYVRLGGIGRDAENVAIAMNDGPWQDAESGWLSESQYCPSPPSASCPLVINGHETGHFVNIVSPDVIWIGVGENLHGTSLPPGGVWSMFDAEYVAYP